LNLNLIGQLLCSLPLDITLANEIQDWTARLQSGQKKKYI
jgi:hypothetical protein